MPCNITAPTLNSCNDLKGGVKILELALWEKNLNPASATWNEIPLLINSAYARQTPSVNAENQTSMFTHEIFFKVNGIANFPGWGDLVQSRVVARVTLHNGDAYMYGLENGMSHSGGSLETGQNIEDAIGSTMTFSGISTIPAAIDTVP